MRNNIKMISLWLGWPRCFKNLQFYNSLFIIVRNNWQLRIWQWAIQSVVKWCFYDGFALKDCVVASFIPITLKFRHTWFEASVPSAGCSVKSWPAFAASLKAHRQETSLSRPVLTHLFQEDNYWVPDN